MSGATRCPILYQDEALLIVNKPAGVLSHPNPSRGGFGDQTKKVLCAFEGNYDFANRRFDTPKGSVWLIHRLDQDASGALLAARSSQAAKKCRQFFERYQVRRTYLALISRQPEPQRGKWEDYLFEQKRSKFVRCFIDPKSKPNAELIYRVRKYFPRIRLSWIEFDLVTGKTHQIRAQSAYHGYPVAGDGVYGDFLLNRKLRKTIGLRRLFLHASCLEFKHPGTKKLVTIDAPLPEELADCMKRLS